MAYEDAKLHDRELFGPEETWRASKWSASDDRVRGGKSQSYLDVSDDTAKFHGELDITTLGGAGFASQKTSDEWDLEEYVGIALKVKEGDKKRYTFILKDTTLPKDPQTGREQATISYEADFTLPSEVLPGPAKKRTVIIPFDSLNATYRGKLQKDAPPIKRGEVRQLSLMCRSFFGNQSGEFSLTLNSITAIRKIPNYHDDDDDDDDDTIIVMSDQIPDTDNGTDVEHQTQHPARPFGLRRKSRVLIGVASVAAIMFLVFWLDGRCGS